MQINSDNNNISSKRADALEELVSQVLDEEFQSGQSEVGGWGGWGGASWGCRVRLQVGGWLMLGGGFWVLLSPL